jgi:hypothetical protein
MQWICCLNLICKTRLTISRFTICFYIKLSRDLFRLFAQFTIITSVDSIKIVITINRSCLLTVQGSIIEIMVGLMLLRMISFTHNRNSLSIFVFD